MRSFPVDMNRLTNVVAVSEASPDVDLDGKPKANRDGEPLHVVQVAVTFDGAVSLVKVKVAGEAPKVAVGAPVTLLGLVGLQWQMAGRHGIAWSAQAIRPAASVTVPPASPPAKN